MSRAELLPVTPEALTAWSQGVAKLAEMTIGLLAPQDLRDIWIDATPWLADGAEDNPQVSAVLRAYAAAASRDAQGMYERAGEVLAMEDAAFDPLLREHMLVIGILGAIASGQPEAVDRLETEFGNSGSDSMVPIRYFLKVWADNKTPVCTDMPQNMVH